VQAPEVGYLWTPPWWGWEGGVYLFHAGWWGPHVGFYGGINYGFGYFGNGFYGGRWQGDHFFYNREVINVVNVRNVYEEHVTIVNNSHVAFNGGSGGIQARPSSQEQQWTNERHIGPVAAQTQHINAARGNPELRASVNRGKPPIAATARPGDFRSNAVPAKAAGGEYRPAEHEARPGAPVAAERRAAAPTPAHVKDLPPAEKLPPPNTGNPKLDKQYQKQQQKMEAQQEKERQQLQKQQEKEHAQLAKQNAPPERQQQVEQKHQQQTQALVQKHTEQRQQAVARQSAPRESKRK
jgi:flagellar biosynthesis GTPase FlhF